MKKTLLITAMLSLGMSSAFAAVLQPGSGATHKRGDSTSTPGMVLTEDMTFGTLTHGALGGAIPQGGDYYAGDVTVSLWIDTSKISAGTTLFGYYGRLPGADSGANGLVLNADGTLSMGGGKFDKYQDETIGSLFSDSKFTLTSEAGRKDTTTGTVAFGDAGGLTNITLSIKGTNQNQLVDIYLNGTLLDTLSYNGNMTGKYGMRTWLNESLTYGEIKTVNSRLEAGDIAAFAKFGTAASVPEPTTATLSLLGLIALVMHRRRRA